MNSSADDDLYGDLDLTLDKRGEKPKGSQNTASSTIRYPSGNKMNVDGSSTANEKTASLLQKIKLLEEENLRLKRNIGTLYRTAKNEIQRKDNQIEQLQKQLDKQP